MTLLLFPGVIFHELSHLIMCIILGVKVTKVNISLNKGFVQHVVPKSILKSMLISVAPSLFSIVFSVIMMNIFFKGFYEIIKIYLVFVVLYVSAPSKEDTNFLKHHSLLSKVIGFPFFILFRIYYYISKNKYTKIIYSLSIMVLSLIVRIVYELKILF